MPCIVTGPMDFTSSLKNSASNVRVSPHGRERFEAMMIALTAAVLIVGILTLVVTLHFSPNFRADHKKYKRLSVDEVDILKAMAFHKVSRIYPSSLETAKYMSLEPFVSNRVFVRVSHLNVSGPYYEFAVDRLCQVGILRQSEEQHFILTGIGEEFLKKFVRKLDKHAYSGVFEDIVHRERVKRISRHGIFCTVHSGSGYPLLGTDANSHLIELPPSEQSGGVVALIIVGGLNLDIGAGATILIRTYVEPYFLPLMESQDVVASPANGNNQRIYLARLGVIELLERTDGTTLIYAG